MGTIPAPNIAGDAMQIAEMPQNALAEYARIAQLQQQTQQAQQAFPLEQQQRQLQIEAQQRQFADQDALTKTIMLFGAGQHSLSEIPQMVTANGGSGEAALKVQAGLIQQKQAYLKMTDEQFADEQKKADLIQGAHDEISQALPGQKQEVYSAAMHRLSAAGVDVSNEPIQYPGDAVFSQHLPAIRLHSAIIADADKDRQITAQEQEAQAKVLGAQTQAQEFAAKLPGGPLQNPDIAEMNDYLAKNPGKGPSDYVAWKAKQTPLARFQIETAAANAGAGGNAAQVAQRFGMSPEAFDRAAEVYNSTGQLPQMGRGISGIALNRALMNRAAELHPGESLAENSAEYKANQSSLSKLQTNFDQVTAFENTAGKNLDQFLATAKNVVDFGSPLINMPLRKAASMAGSGDQAAYNAARTTALTEISKVLNSSNASGVLSDSARQEVEQLIGPNASLKQIYSAAQILKQDMANRHQAYQEQIQNIQGRMGPKKNQPTNQGGGGNHIIRIGNDRYQYKGSGDTADLNNYTKLP